MGAPAGRDMLGYTVAITADDPVLAGLLDRCYVGFPLVEHPEHLLAVTPDDATGFDVFVDGARVAHADDIGGTVPVVVGHLNRTAAEASPHALVHAGGVERDGVGVVLPAPMESGKTTLTTGLVRAGFRYLTDEAVAFDRVTGTIVPYPKPLSLDQGSWALFPELEPHEPFATDEYKAHQWLVPPGAIRADVLAPPCRADFVVFPVYQAGTTTRLEALSRAEALVELTKNTFRFDREGRPTLELLAEVIRHAEAYRLPNCDLDDAVAAISRLVAG